MNRLAVDKRVWQVEQLGEIKWTVCLPTGQLPSDDTDSAAQEIIISEPMYDVPWLDEAVFKKLQSLPRPPDVAVDADDDL